MTETSNKSWPSVNALAAPLAAALVRDAAALRIRVESWHGCTLVDGGIDCPGGIEAGRRIAEICLGGLGVVTFAHAESRWPLTVQVHTANPVLACLGSQYAGWSLAHGEGKGAFFSLGSGPARAVAAREDLFAELGYRDAHDSACLVLETGKRPPPEIIGKVTRDCGIAPDRLTVILTPTGSLAGGVQIAARVLEVALHKVHALGFPLDAVVDGAGAAPVPPPAGDFLTAMGRTNDAILYGGRIELFVDADDDSAHDLADKLPSSGSKDFGRPFAEIFKDCNYDFYRIDPQLFAPAQVLVSNLKSGRSFRAGALHAELVDQSFG